MVLDSNLNTSGNLDLNSPPIEDYITEGAFVNVPLLNDRGKAALTKDSQGGHSSIQHVLQEGKEGIHNPPIDVEDIDDELELLSSPINFPQARSGSKRKKPGVIVIDDGINGSENKVDLDLTISLFHHDHKRSKNAYVKSANDKSYARELNFLDKKESQSVNDAKASETAEPKEKSQPMNDAKASEAAQPKESPFNCPVCLLSIVHACSTVCGHIFCEKCIKESVAKLKKCPTCRRKLTASKYHRIYLPSDS